MLDSGRALSSNDDDRVPASHELIGLPGLLDPNGAHHDLLEQLCAIVLLAGCIVLLSRLTRGERLGARVGGPH